MSRVNVIQHIATLERLVASVTSVDVSALAAVLTSSSSASFSSSSSASSSSSDSDVQAAAAQASSPMELEAKRVLVHCFYQGITARKYCQDIVRATSRNDLASLARLRAAEGAVLVKLAELETVMNAVFSERHVAMFSDPSVSLTEQERSMATEEQQVAFDAMLRGLPVFVANNLREHQGAAVPCTQTLLDPASGNMRFVQPRELKDTLYGKVIRAAEASSQQSVAIKLSSWAKYASRHLAENPMREARMNQYLQPVPPSIVAVREVGCDAENHWTVMEFVDGGDLFDQIIRSEGVAEHTAWKWMHQAVDALEHCHSRGIAHLDVSTENFMVTRAGDLKLCDFGQARLVSMAQQPDGRLVELPFPADTSFGTKLYCQPPEMVMKLPVRGTQVDMFSLGVVLYTMLQGCRPFQHGAWMHDGEYGRCCQGLAAEIARNARMQCQANQAHPSQGCLLDAHCTFCGSAEAAASNSSCRISSGAAEVIARLLCPPESRATLAEVRQLAWMQQMPVSALGDTTDDDDLESEPVQPPANVAVSVQAAAAQPAVAVVAAVAELSPQDAHKQRLQQEESPLPGLRNEMHL